MAVRSVRWSGGRGWGGARTDMPQHLPPEPGNRNRGEGETVLCGFSPVRLGRFHTTENRGISCFFRATVATISPQHLREPREVVGSSEGG